MSTNSNNVIQTIKNLLPILVDTNQIDIEAMDYCSTTLVKHNGKYVITNPFFDTPDNTDPEEFYFDDTDALIKHLTDNKDYFNETVIASIQLGGHIEF